MSLRGRLFVIVLAIGLGMLGAEFYAIYWVQADWRSRNLGRFQNHLRETIFDYAAFNYASASGATDGVGRVRDLLRRTNRGHFADFYDDLIVISGGVSGHTGADAGGVSIEGLPLYVDLNPLGAAHRDPLFPRAEIRAAIQRAMDDGLLVRAGDGFCVGIERDDEVVGGVWFQPKLPPLPELSAQVFVVPILLGVVLFGLIVYWSLGRSIRRPLRDVSAAAVQVGAGRYDVRVPRLPGGSELDGLIDAFNGMTEKVEGQHAELEREVRRATDEAKRKERALVLSGRLASMGTMAAGIAHEINNPIGGMINAIRRIAANESLSERDRRRQALRRLDHLM